MIFYLFIRKIAANDADIEPTLISATIHELSALVMVGMGESSRRNFEMNGDVHPRATADDNSIIEAEYNELFPLLQPFNIFSKEL